MEAYIADCLRQLDGQYPNWKTNTFGKNTICIPEASDICYGHEPNSFCTTDPEAVDYDSQFAAKTFSNIRGRCAEKLVHQAFQRSKIGGVLIQHITSQKIFSYLKRFIPAELRKQAKNQNDPNCQYEIDFLYFHPVLGFFVIECKAKEKIRYGAYKKPLQQARKNFGKLKNIIGKPFNIENVNADWYIACYPKGCMATDDCTTNDSRSTADKSITNDSTTNDEFDISSLPDNSTESGDSGTSSLQSARSSTVEVQEISESADDNRNPTDYTLKDDEDVLYFSNAQDFETFFRNKTPNAAQVNRNFFEEKIFQRLIAVMFGFREEKFKFMANNAMAIRKMIANQESVKHLIDEPSVGISNNHQNTLNSKKYRKFQGKQQNPKDICCHNNTENETTPKDVPPFKYKIIMNNVETDLHLNSNQISAYKRFEQSKKNTILFGPPGSGKTLLIMLLARAAATQPQKNLEKPGRVFILVPSNALAKMYETFFEKNFGDQKQQRDIIISPSKKEIRSLTKKDVIFADEIFTGFWLPTAGEKKYRKALIGITVGRFCHQNSAEDIKEILMKTLRHTKETTDYVHLNTVMRNTNNIFSFYNRFIDNKRAEKINNIDERSVSNSQNTTAVISMDNATSSSQDSASNTENASTGSTSTEDPDTSVPGNVPNVITEDLPPENFSKRIPLGHSVEGRIVEEISVTNIEEVCKFIKLRIAKLFGPPYPPQNEMSTTISEIEDTSTPNSADDDTAYTHAVVVAQDSTSSSDSSDFIGIDYDIETSSSSCNSNTSLSSSPIHSNSPAVSRSKRSNNQTPKATCSSQPPAKQVLRLSDIAIIVAHEPVNEQIEQIIRFLENEKIPDHREALQGTNLSPYTKIRAGSIKGHMKNPNLPMVVVDSSANVLSFEWCIVFVIDASNCFYSKRLANPIVPLSRAISSLIVFQTVDCGVYKNGEQKMFLQCGHLGKIVKSTLSFTQTKVDNHHRLEGALFRSWQSQYQKAVLLRNFVFIVALLLTIGTTVYGLNDYDITYQTIVIFLIIVDLLNMVFVVFVTSCEYAKKQETALAVEIWTILEIAKKLFVFVAIIVGISYAGYEYRNSHSFFSIFIATLLITFVIALLNHLFMLDLFAFASAERRQSFGWCGMYLNSLRAMIICFIPNAIFLIGASLFLSVDEGFRFFIIATLSVIFPVIFLLLTQDDIRALRPLRLSVTKTV